MTPAHLLSHLRAVVLGLLACAGLASLAPSARASTDATAEYRVKAAYLYNFTKFVEWPADRAREVPFVVGVIDPAGAAAKTIAETLRGKSTPDGRPIEVRTFATLGPAIAACHQLFLTKKSGFTPAAVRAVVGDSAAVLIIGETEGFAENGGIINLLASGDAVRCEVNLAGASRAGVKLSGRLASVARLVRETARP